MDAVNAPSLKNVPKGMAHPHLTEIGHVELLFQIRKKIGKRIKVLGGGDDPLVCLHQIRIHHLISPFVLERGEEVQAVFKTPRELREQLTKVEIWLLGGSRKDLFSIIVGKSEGCTRTEFEITVTRNTAADHRGLDIQTGALGWTLFFSWLVSHR